MLPLNTVVKFYTSFKIGEKGVYMSEPYQKGTFFTLCDFDFMFTGLCLLLMSEMFFSDWQDSESVPVAEILCAETGRG